MKKASAFLTCSIIVSVFLAIWTPQANAFPQYSEGAEEDIEARAASNCRQCHGDYRADPHISLSDGQNWGTELMEIHQELMLAADCETCHFGASPFGTYYPVRTFESFGGQGGLPPIACVGCHGRAEDANATCDPPDPEYFEEGKNPDPKSGMGLRQHHYNVNTVTNTPNGPVSSQICNDCHWDANPAHCDPAVGENVYPPNFFIPDPGHPNKPWDPCNPNGREDFAGISEGLDNDGDNVYDMNDTDCSSIVPEALCFDTIDNDTDGRTDCVDPDCDGAENGPCTGGTLVCNAGFELCRQDPQPAHIPKTGQTKCYDGIQGSGLEIPCAGTGQDGDHQAGVAWPDPRFTDNGDGTVQDNLTGLIWTKDANLPGSRMGWNAALAFCNDLDLGTVGDAWRLPNQNELRSVISFDTFDPSLPLGNPFINVYHGGPPSPSTISPPHPNACEDCGFYWSSTSIGFEGNFAWNAGMHGAHTDFHNVKTDPYGVWCVAGGDDPSSWPAAPQVTGQFTCTDNFGSLINCIGTGQDGEYQMGPPPPTPRFTDNLDGTVTDNWTTLMWTKDANMAGGGPMSWNQALDLCNDLTVDVYDDWRLPHQKELRSLLNLGYGFPALTPGHPFTDVQNSIYWPSSTEPNDFTRSILVNFGFGMLDWYWEKYKELADFGQHNAWCVRAGEGL